MKLRTRDRCDSPVACRQRSDQKTTILQATESRSLTLTSLRPEVVGLMHFGWSSLRILGATATNWTQVRVVSHGLITALRIPALSSVMAPIKPLPVAARQPTSYILHARSLLFFLLFTHYFIPAQILLEGFSEEPIQTHRVTNGHPLRCQKC